MQDFGSKTHRRFKAYALALAVAVVVCSTASAQWQDNLERELEKTDRVIERAYDEIRGLGSVVASQHLDRARDLQRQAREAQRMFAYNRALSLTLSARSQVDRGLSVLRTVDQGRELVQRALERTDEIIGKAGDLAARVKDANVASMMQVAVSAQNEAKNLFKGNRLRVAFKATMRARETAKQVIEILGSRNASSRRVEQELQKTDDLIARATQMAVERQADKAINSLLAEADDIQSSAWKKIAAGDIRFAQKLTANARRLARSALETMEQEDQPKRISRLIEQNQRLLSRISDRLKDHPSPESERLLEVATEHHRKASDAFEAGNFEVAIVEAKAAQDLAAKADAMITE